MSAETITYDDGKLTGLTKEAIERRTIVTNSHGFREDCVNTRLLPTEGKRLERQVRPQRLVTCWYTDTPQGERVIEDQAGCYASGKAVVVRLQQGHQGPVASVEMTTDTAKAFRALLDRAIDEAEKATK